MRKLWHLQGKQPGEAHCQNSYWETTERGGPASARRLPADGLAVNHLTSTALARTSHASPNRPRHPVEALVPPAPQSHRYQMAARGLRTVGAVAELVGLTLLLILVCRTTNLVRRARGCSRVTVPLTRQPPRQVVLLNGGSSASSLACWLCQREKRSNGKNESNHLD